MNTPRTLFFVGSPHFDGIGLLRQEMLNHAQQGHVIEVLDAIMPGRYPDIKNFNHLSALIWRFRRRAQFLAGVDAQYTRLADFVPSAAHLAVRHMFSSGPSISTEVRSIAGIVMHDHAICHVFTDEKKNRWIIKQKTRVEIFLQLVCDYLMHWLRQKSFDQIIVFNGRNPIARLLALCAKKLNITVKWIEYFGKRNHAMTYICTPVNLFDLDAFSDWILQAYRAADEGKREQIAEACLRDRLSQGDPMLQQWGMQFDRAVLPWDRTRRQVLFLFSSEDEYPAFEPSKHGLPDPTRQFDTFLRIGELLAKQGLASSVCLHVKLHPRYVSFKDKLSLAAQAWQQAIEQVRQLGVMVEVHDPLQSPYQLIVSSDMVFSYGSTAWEATYLGKPAFLMGPNGFASHDCTYLMASVEDIVQAIADPLPPPKPKQHCYPYAWGWHELGIIPNAFKPLVQHHSRWEAWRASWQNRFLTVML